MPNEVTAKTRGETTSLAPLLHFLEGLELSVELKDGRVYQGVLKSADALMNLVLSQGRERHLTLRGHASAHVKVTEESDTLANDNIAGKSKMSTSELNGTINETQRQDEEELIVRDCDLVHVRGSFIRYIHFTDSGLDIPSVIKASQNRERIARERYQRRKRKY